VVSLYTLQTIQLPNGETQWADYSEAEAVALQLNQITKSKQKINNQQNLID
jgi:hypothetical protein